MIKKNEHKIYLSNYYFFHRFSKKVLSFRHTKWVKIIKKYNKHLTWRFAPKNNTLIINKKKQWLRIKNVFRKNLEKKNQLKLFSNNGLKYKTLKRLVFIKKNKLERLKTIITHSTYRIDNLLCIIGVFRSLVQARQSILSGEIIVNGVIMRSLTYLLSKGDILSFINIRQKLLDKNLKTMAKRVSFKQFYSFFDIDYYLKELIVVKDSSTLNSSDYSTMLLGYIDLQRLDSLKF